MGLGGLINSITGASNSARQQNQYAVAMSNMNFEQQKYFAQNAHQMEMNDLSKAGLNPALTASGGGGASASGGSAPTGPGLGQGGLGTLGVLADVYNNTRATSANNNMLNAQAELAKANAMRSVEMLPFEKDEKLKIIQNLATSSSLNVANAKYTSKKATGKGFTINTPWGGGGGHW